MKAVLIAIALIVAMCLIGWITFASSADKTTITIDKKAIQEDTRKAVDKGKELIDEAQRTLEHPDKK